MYAAPKRLHAGSKVAIVAPASPFKADELIAGLDIVKTVGLEPVLGPNVRHLKTMGFAAAPVIDQANELMWAFTDPDIEAVICALGGLGSGASLPYLNFGAIRGSRRCLLGLSDITALNNGMLAGAGLCSINGQYPAIRLAEGRFNREADSESLKFTLQMMMDSLEWGERPWAISQYLPRTLSPGKAVGHAVGGNLDTLCTLLGTPFMPDFDGAILFIEDVHKSPEAIARLLLHVKLAGILDRVGGIVVGEFVDVKDNDTDHPMSLEDVLREYLSDGPPCVYGYSFSHGPYTCPIPIGARTELNADTGQVSFHFSMAS